VDVGWSHVRWMGLLSDESKGGLSVTSEVLRLVHRVITGSYMPEVEELYLIICLGYPIYRVGDIPLNLARVLFRGPLPQLLHLVR
jgi:hypothetical protein